MNGNSSISANSALTLEVLAAIVVFGIASFIWVPKNPVTISIIITALVGVLQNLIGIKAGGKLPEQVGGPQAGQSAQTETTTTVSTQTPPTPSTPPPPPEVTP